jgi:hypothetical protein
VKSPKVFDVPVPLLGHSIRIANFERGFFSTHPALEQFRVPTKEDARLLPREHREMSNDVLLIRSSQGDHDAAREVLVREIMFVDNLSWHDAQPKLEELEAANKEMITVGTIPYKAGLVVSVVAGFGSIPMCFSLSTTKWFNENFVTADVAEDKDLETWLEVGSWAWAWMEPPLGQLSFLLLCLAYARNQMLNLGWKPYTSWLKNSRAERLQKRYPQYNKGILQTFSETDSWS